MEAIGTFDVLSGQHMCKFSRGQQDRTILPAAETQDAQLRDAFGQD